MTKSAINTAAEGLHNYIKFRATREGVGYGLTSGFFAAALKEGVRAFFGIEVSETGVLIADSQNPEAFAAHMN